VLIKCPECNTDVSSAAASCPKCGHPIAPASATPPKLTQEPVKQQKRGIGGIGCLGAIGVVLFLAVIGSAINPSKPPTSSPGTTATETATATTPAAPSPELELKSSRCYTEYDYIITEGAVTNISGQSMKNVEAVAGYYDKDSTLITSDDALISYNPILPGQTSPFKTMTRHNPEMKRCGVTFKYLMGGTIETREAEKPAKK